MVETPATAPDAAGRPDVDALMERVRAGVADKIARGVWTKEELERVERPRRCLRCDLAFTEAAAAPEVRGGGHA